MNTLSPTHALPGSVTDTESVRSQHLDLDRLTTVQFDHALHLGECYVVTVLHAVASVIQTSDDALTVAGNASDHRADRRLAIRVHHRERVAEITEYLGEEATSVGDYEGDTVGAGDP